jgi:tRNA threonylcarbamoyladenosine biosynthesis protein TsaE
MDARMKQRAETPEAMLELGRQAAAAVRPGDVIALIGGLGAGKTHWTKGLVAGIGSAAEVTSPTFGLVHEYPGGRLPIFHFDFYRLESAEELIALGWDEYLEANGVIVAEWGDRFPEALPAETVRLVFSLDPDGGRSVAREE